MQFQNVLENYYDRKISFRRVSKTLNHCIFDSPIEETTNITWQLIKPKTNMSKIYENFFRPSFCLPQDYFFVHLKTAHAVYDLGINQFFCFSFFFNSILDICSLIFAARSSSGLTIIDHSSNLTVVRSHIFIQYDHSLSV